MSNLAEKKRAGDNLPIYQQIKDDLKTRIICEVYKHGQQLPSIRELSVLYECSAITSRKVYEELEKEGFIRTTPGRGTFVNVDSETIQHFRRLNTEKAMRDAVNTGLNCGYTTEEMIHLFSTLLYQAQKTQE
ncbi:GntR family transcriptional regulator [Paenibacillus sp. MMO-58]|uniref:GntR family transcriptional regulator n=1 Tax=Paenibacillus sp. MMO-58 TaxID=3081290 RepID=UPI00301B6615